MSMIQFSKYHGPKSSGAKYRGVILAVLISLASTLAQAGQEKKTEQQLIEALRAAPPAEKALACKQLATLGTKQAVPELARLLSDKQLASWARIALEAIPDCAADEALRNAVGTLQGRLLVGAINSIGVRKDSAAVVLLSGKLNHQDLEVASAAAAALGGIGNDAAATILRQALASPTSPVRGAVAEGCILCAERLTREGRSDEAAQLYDEVRQADVPKPRKLEATRGAILARKSAGLPLLVEQLRSPDRAYFQIGLSTARELPGHEVSDQLAAELARTSPERASLLLYSIADRRDPRVLPAVLAAANEGEKPVRLVAIGVVGRLGNASNLGPLLEVAGDADAELSEAAKQAITALSDQKADSEITSQLAAADGKPLIVLIDLVGRRRIAATDLLTKRLDHADQAIRGAALTALGATISPKELGVLLSQAIKPKNAADAQAARSALRAACLRMPDRDACAAELAAAMSQASVATQSRLLEILGAMGGAKALETIHVAMKSNVGELQDAGSRVLGEWLNVDAAPVLLELAKSASDDKYRVRALRGYLRLARQFATSDEQRAEMCQNAIAAAGRTDEQKLALSILERHPCRDALNVAAKATQSPELKQEASRVTLAIAEKLGGDGAKLRELLDRASLEPVKLDIVKAEYGSGASKKDVTEMLQKCVGDLPLIVLPSKTYNDSFGGDPAPGTEKILKVHYQINGKAGDVTFPENALIAIPMPK